MDALWKLNSGVSYEFQKDETVAYQKDIPTGTKLASVEKIGGRTLVWNQALPESNYTNSSATDSRDTLSLYIRCITNDGSYSSVLAKEVKETGLKKYIFNSTVDCTMDVVKHDGINTDLYFLYSKYAFKANHTYLFAIKFDGVNPTVLGGVSCSNFQLFDLTRMFGPDNEPSTVEEFEAMFPADYYPYNAGELMSAPVNEVTYSDTQNQETSYQIPLAILNLPGYGWSAGDVCNKVDWENKKYVQRVASVDMGTLKWDSTTYNRYYSNVVPNVVKCSDTMKSNILTVDYTTSAKASVELADMQIAVASEKVICLCNQTVLSASELKTALKDKMLYYELAEPIVTDISDLISEGFLEAMEVEVGGSLTFQNTHGDNYRVPVPNTVEYTVKLSEVAG